MNHEEFLFSAEAAGRRKNQTMQHTQSQDLNWDGHVRGSARAFRELLLLRVCGVYLPVSAHTLYMLMCVLCVYCVPIVSGVVIFSHHDRETVFI